MALAAGSAILKVRSAFARPSSRPPPPVTSSRSTCEQCRSFWVQQLLLHLSKVPSFPTAGA